MNIRIDRVSIRQSGRADEMRLLKRFELLLGSVNMKLSELAAKVSQQAEVAEKIVAEIQVLKTELSDVDIPQGAVDSLARLDAALASADGLNVDVENEPVDETETNLG